MAISVIQVTGVQSSGSVASVSKAFTSNLTADNSVVAAVNCSANTTITGAMVTDSQGGSYTRATEVHTAGDGSSAICYRNSVSAAACTVTFDSGSDYMDIAIAEVAPGSGNVLAVNTSKTATGAGTPYTTGNYTTTVDTIVVANCSHNGAGSAAPIISGGNQTIIFEDSDGSDMVFSAGYRLISASTTSSTWGTVSGSNAFQAASAAFEAQAAGGGGDPEGALVRGKLVGGGLLMRGVLIGG